MKNKLLHLSLALSVCANFGYGKLIPINEVFEPEGAFDPSLYAKVAVLQWAPSEPAPIGVNPEEAETFKQKNREVLAKFIDEAVQKGAKLIVTPEFSVVGYPDIPGLPPEEDQFQSREQVKPYVEPVNGPSTKFFGELAKKNGVYIHFGIAEMDVASDLYYNTVVVVGPEGRILARYRKIHLYQSETKFLENGDEIVTYHSMLGEIGLAICSDVYSPFPMDAYRKLGISVLALSSSWAQWNTGMDYYKEGAKWVSAYVLASNHSYFPDAGVVNPDGTTQSHIRQSKGLAYGYLPYRRFAR